MMIVFYIATTLTIFLILALFGAPIILKPSMAARRISRLFKVPVLTRERLGPMSACRI